VDDDGTETERVMDEAAAEAASETLEAASTATVDSVRRRTRTDDPPAPFNTTQFIRAAGSLGYSAQRAMSIAEDLYTAGYVTYPRTDNTVYPDDLDPRELLDAFVGTRQFGDDADALLEQDDVDPTEGDEETTDHPPIHPTGELPGAADLDDDEWEVYELVVRRFFATVAEPATWERLRVVAGVEAPDEPLSLKANGKRLLEPGYHAVYPYSSASESFVPDVSEGEELAVTGTSFEAKQTQPPRRYGQSRLIETMEDLGVGTKSTRHNVIQKLYDRGYIESDPPRPTRLARAVVEAAEEFAERIVSEEMTAQLEADMQAITRGDATLADVTEESREILDEVFEGLMASGEAVGEHLQESLKADRTVGECPECGSDLVIRQSRQGSYFIGCDAYPACTNTLPLPSTGKPLLLEDTCEDHGLAHIKMLAGRKTFVHGCPLCRAEAADARADRVIGSCPECGAGAAASAAPRDGGGDAADAGGELAIKQLRSGSRLVGCTRYPECEYSLPLPRRGEIKVTDAACDEHGLPELRIVYEGDRDPWELGCPICNYREYQAERAGGSELESVSGIGQKTAAKLQDAGIDDVPSLKQAEPDAVAARVDGVGPDTVREWQAKAD
jgi:DNA topoisomerase-1